MDYDDSNRAFLQAFLARNTLTLETAKPILAAILSVHAGREVLANDITLQDLNSYIAAANTAISPLDFEVRSTLHQQTGVRYYSLVNTTSDALTQLATTFTAEEIAFVKRVLDAMFEGPNNRGRKEAMCLTSMEAVNFAKPSGRRDTENGATQNISQGLSMRDAETTIKRLVEEGWFEKSPKGFHSLSARGLMELKGWLVETYNEPAEDDDEPRKNKIKFCYACKDIITVGQRCSRRECPCRLHEICRPSFFRSQKSDTCPLCKTAWDSEHFVGEKAITTTDDYLKGKRKSGVSRRAPEVEADEDEDSNDG